MASREFRALSICIFDIEEVFDNTPAMEISDIILI
jgi:hypothetical protein